MLIYSKQLFGPKDPLLPPIVITIKFIMTDKFDLFEIYDPALANSFDDQLQKKITNYR